jgi:NTE family protein
MLRINSVRQFLSHGVSRWASSAAALVLAGCSAIPVVQNQPVSEGEASLVVQRASAQPTALPERYSLMEFAQRKDLAPVKVLLAFSGGGTRAAAMSYGVLRSLQAQAMPPRAGGGELLDRVGVISSVSGGSFTAAYYGLYGRKGLDDFEKKFLRRNLKSELLSAAFSPLQLFSTTGRTDVAEHIYAQTLFPNATFADLRRADGPLIVINATDLSRGVNFAFLQEYFDLLCSDLSSFPVARAVTASSAVPVLFTPVVLRNYKGCSQEEMDSYLQAVLHLSPTQALRYRAETLRSYADKEDRPYVHLVDGGISDNLGLRAINDFVDMAGGMKSFAALTGFDRGPIADQLMVIAVDASISESEDMDKSVFSPSIEQTLNAVSSIQLHRYNDETLDKSRVALTQWASDLSTPAHTV